MENHNEAVSQLFKQLSPPTGDNQPEYRNWLFKYGFLGLSDKELNIPGADVTASVAAQYRSNFRLLGISALHVAAHFGKVDLIAYINALVQGHGANYLEELLDRGTDDVRAHYLDSPESALVVQPGVMEDILNRFYATGRDNFPFPNPLSLTPATSPSSKNIAKKMDSITTTASSLTTVADVRAFLLPLYNHRDAIGCTPLHYAARAGEAPAFHKLCHLGADLNATNILGSTPLHEVVAKDNGPIRSHFFPRSGDELTLTQRDLKVFPFGSALEYAIRLGRDVMAIQLIEQFGFKLSNASSEYYGPPIIQLASSVNLSLLKKLAPHGIDPHSRHPLDNKTAAHVAVYSSHPSSQIIPFLEYLHTELKGDINVEVDGVTPIVSAAKTQALDVVQWFAKKGVPLNQPALLKAANNTPEIATWLSKAQAGAE